MKLNTIIATAALAALSIATSRVGSDRISGSGRRFLGRAEPDEIDVDRSKGDGQPKVPVLDSHGYAAPQDGAPSIHDVVEREPSYGRSGYPQSLYASHQVALEGSSDDNDKYDSDDGTVTVKMANRQYKATTSETLSREQWRRAAIEEIKKEATALSAEEHAEMVELGLETLRDIEETLEGAGFSLFDGISIRAHSEIDFVVRMLEATPPGREAILKFENEINSQPEEKVGEGKSSNGDTPLILNTPNGLELSQLRDSNAKARRKRSGSGDLSHFSKRESTLTTIDKDEAEAGSGNKTSSQLTAEFEMYLAAFEGAQANASEIIMPIIQRMTAGTNSSLIFGAAWSLYSDLTFSSPYVIGPFTHGVNCLNWIEDNIFNITQYNTSDPVQKRLQTQILAVDQMLLDLYNEAWSNATAALNETGLLTDMMTLAQYLSPEDKSILPPGYANYSSPAYDTSFFTAPRNSTNN